MPERRTQQHASGLIWIFKFTCSKGWLLWRGNFHSLPVNNANRADEKDALKIPRKARTLNKHVCMPPSSAFHHKEDTILRRAAVKTQTRLALRYLFQNSEIFLWARPHRGMLLVGVLFDAGNMWQEVVHSSMLPLGDEPWCGGRAQRRAPWRPKHGLLFIRHIIDSLIT